MTDDLDKHLKDMRVSVTKQYAYWQATSERITETNKGKGLPPDEFATRVLTMLAMMQSSMLDMGMVIQELEKKVNSGTS